MAFQAAKVQHLSPWRPQAQIVQRRPDDSRLKPTVEHPWEDISMKFHACLALIYTYLCLFHVNTPSLGAQFLKVAWNCSPRSARDKNRGFGCLSLCAQPGRQEESRGLGNVSSAWAGTLGFIFCRISCTRFGGIHTHTPTHARYKRIDCSHRHVYIIYVRVCSI